LAGSWGRCGRDERLTVGTGAAADGVVVAIQKAPANTGIIAAPRHRFTLDIPLVQPVVGAILR
jgi:hypothetical protein